jgi:hypothetical protein
MFRSTMGSIVLAAALIGCNDRESLRQDQQQEQQELSREQAQERQELQREQAEERAAAAEAARRNLAEQAEDVQEERADVAADARRLEESVALACQGTPAAVADTCPIERRHLASTSDRDDGVDLHLARTAGSEADFEHRIDCYRARASLRAATAPANAPARPAADACILDLADVNVNVTQQDGHVVIGLTSSVRARVEELKAQGRRLTATARN